VRHLTYNYLVSVNTWLLLYPCDLCCDWTMGTVPLIESWMDPRNLATVATFAVLFMLARTALSRSSDRHSNIVIMVCFVRLVVIPNWLRRIKINCVDLNIVLCRDCH